MLFDETTFSLLKRVINKDGWLNLPAYGDSMFPYIQQGDLCRFTPCNPDFIKKGDVILFYSEAGQLIAHRFVQKKIINNKQLFLFKGDTNLGFDQPIEEDKILGRLISIEKQNINITSNQLSARLWGKLIVMIPALSGILRKLINMKYKLQF
ncbi:signal peptidase I [Bacillus sp. EB106-08-02-XG196]|jgi:signal peptidase I|uniref:signal peptidase I n=1 Tax=Bacillus sp. EB106-08-02-XG196 TaxID=2737049 RepID=UPI0015C4B365|nr:signal peptidase I [Bacillus sp. EB106-08-02-XG196]NWQ39140.1 signal peptidase I [Bacillus sp. EB106-08-02-XG196]